MNRLRRPLLNALALSITTLTASGALDASAGASTANGTGSVAKTAANPTTAPVATLASVRIDRPAGLKPEVLDLAKGAATCAQSRGLVDAPKTLTIIDYSMPSTEARLWVLDLRTGRSLYQEIVAHGRGSGGNLATMFSNAADSHQTSLGLFVTEDTYVGQNGYSMRLHGLEPGINDQARARAIVMHGASYVDPALGSSQGRIGRSWGCPALRPAIARELIDRIKGGNLLFAYYPDKAWLTGSAFLNSCSAA